MPSTNNSFSTQLATWALGLDFEQLPSELIQDVKLRLLDTLGLILGAATTLIGTAVTQAVTGLNDGYNARLLPSGQKTSASFAALAHGTQAHAEDFDDTHNESIMHSSASVVALVLALGEAQRLNGTQVLTAIALGNELNCRLGCVVPGGFHRFGFHPSGVLASLTTALTAARLMNLQHQQCVHAMGIAGSQASGILEAYEDGSWSKTLHPGWAAHAGIVAATLAGCGFSGPTTVIEGRFGVFRAFLRDEGSGADQYFAFERLTNRLGTDWEQLNSSFKPYPCAHAIHSFVEAALVLRRQYQIDPADIVAIKAEVAEHFVAMICEPISAKQRPQTPTHARASLPYALAAALQAGNLNPQHYTPEAIIDPQVLALIDKVSYRLDVNAPSLTQYQGIVEIVLNDGNTHQMIIPNNWGSRENPMGEQDIIEKFHACTQQLPRTQREIIVENVLRLELISDLRVFIDCCML